MPLVRTASGRSFIPDSSIRGKIFEPPDTRTAKPLRSILAGKRMHRRPYYTKVRFGNPDAASYSDYSSQVDAVTAQRALRIDHEKATGGYDRDIAKLRNGQELDEMQQFRRARRESHKNPSVRDLSPTSRIQRAKDKMWPPKALFQSAAAGNFSAALSLTKALSGRRWWPRGRSQPDDLSGHVSHVAFTSPTADEAVYSDSKHLQDPSHWWQTAANLHPYGYSTYARPSSSRRSSQSSISKRTDDTTPQHSPPRSKDRTQPTRSNSYGDSHSSYHGEPFGRSGDRHRASTKSSRRHTLFERDVYHSQGTMLPQKHDYQQYALYHHQYYPHGQQTYHRRPTSARSDASFGSHSVY